MTNCEGCAEDLVEGYSITLTLCHDCMVDLEEWLKHKVKSTKFSLCCEKSPRKT